MQVAAAVAAAAAATQWLRCGLKLCWLRPCEASRRWLIHSADSACTVDKKHSNRTCAVSARATIPKTKEEADENEDAINACDFHSYPYPFYVIRYPYPFAVRISPAGQLSRSSQLSFSIRRRTGSALQRFAEVLPNPNPLPLGPPFCCCCIHVIAILAA